MRNIGAHRFAPGVTPGLSGLRIQLLRRWRNGWSDFARSADVDYFAEKVAAARFEKIERELGWWLAAT
jgi:hypothetical protein